MSDEMTFTLHSPLTEEEWDMITDVDLDHTPEITFHTKHGKEVVFVKRKTGKWINRWAQNGDQVKEVRECSECGAVYLRFYDTADGFDCVPPKYCPNCGCAMEVET